MIQTPTRPLPVAELRRLESEATPAPWCAQACPEGFGWLPAGPYTLNPNILQVMADARMIKVSRNLMPEMIALWEAAERREDDASGLADALVTLNAKADAVFAKTPQID